MSQRFRKEGAIMFSCPKSPRTPKQSFFTRFSGGNIQQHHELSFSLCCHSRGYLNEGLASRRSRRWSGKFKVRSESRISYTRQDGPICSWTDCRTELGGKGGETHTYTHTRSQPLCHSQVAAIHAPVRKESCPTEYVLLPSGSSREHSRQINEGSLISELGVGELDDSSFICCLCFWQMITRKFSSELTIGNNDEDFPTCHFPPG